MKTPRQVLLDYAVWAQPKLDRQRQKWINQLNNYPVQDSSLASTHRSFWFALIRGVARAGQELLWIPRRAWIGLAMVWLVLSLVHWGDQPEAVSGPTTVRLPWAQVVRVWQEQYRLASEESARSPASNRLPTPTINGPHSQRQRSPHTITV